MNIIRFEYNFTVDDCIHIIYEYNKIKSICFLLCFSVSLCNKLKADFKVDTQRALHT
jgi:hypothetical protein